MNYIVTQETGGVNSRPWNLESGERGIESSGRQKPKGMTPDAPAPAGCNMPTFTGALMATLTKPAIEPIRVRSEEAIRGDLIQPGHPLFGIVWINPERMGGTPCFAGTRVPVQALFDDLEAGDGLEVFLDDFEGVTRAQAIAVLDASRSTLGVTTPRALPLESGPSHGSGPTARK